MGKKDAENYAQLQKDFESLKKRRQKDIEDAEKRGQEKAIQGLLDLVDDCDRALNQMYSGSDYTLVTEGMRQLRNQTMRRFKALGIEPHGKVGEKFDPVWHDAILAEELPGPSGQIVHVHTIGWYHKENQKVIRPATVTVSKPLSAEKAAELETKRAMLKERREEEYSSRSKTKNKTVQTKSVPATLREEESEAFSKKVLAQAGECFYGNPRCVNNSCPECQLRFKTLDVRGEE